MVKRIAIAYGEEEDELVAVFNEQTEREIKKNRKIMKISQQK